MSTDSGMRESILAAGEAAFRSLGYHGTSVNKVVKLAGVSKGGFYHHFPSKEALFVEVVERVLLAAPTLSEGGTEEGGGTGARGQAAPDSDEKSIEASLRELFLAPLQRDADYLPILFDAIKASPLVREQVAGLYESHRSRCQLLLEKGKEQGAIRVHLDAASWAFQIVASVEGAFLLSAVAPDSAAHGELADALERLFETLWRVIRRIEI